MSKRAQESACVAKPRPMNLVSRNFLSAKKTPPQPGESRIGSELRVTQRQETDAKHPPTPTLCSQERQQDDTLPGRRDEPSSSDSARKLERGEDIQIGRSETEFHNMQISDHRYLEKVFKNLRKKLNLAEEAPVIGVEALKTNVLIWGLPMSTTTNVTIHLKPKYIENLEVYRNTNFEELQNLFDIAQKWIIGPSI